MKTGTKRAKKRATILQMWARLQRKKVGRTCFVGAARAAAAAAIQANGSGPGLQANRQTVCLVVNYWRTVTVDDSGGLAADVGAQ